ncbi:MAG: hypothetical protein ACE5GM_09030 [bacterium]
MKKATKLTEVLQTLVEEPLTADQMEEFYVDCTKGRGDNQLAKIKRQLLRVPEQKMLFCSHRGSGKSTELNRLAADEEIRERFIPIPFSIYKELDPINLSYLDVLTVMVEQMLQTAKSEEIKVDQFLIERIYEWAEVSEVEAIKKESSNIKADGGAEAKTNILGIIKLFARIKASLKSEEENRKTIRKVYKANLGVLFEPINLLIKELELGSGKKLLLIIDDLEKLDPATARGLFFEQAAQLIRFTCHCLYTFPISLRYSPEFTDIKGYFSYVALLPMIKINEKGGKNPHSQGIAALENVIKKRMDRRLFNDNAFNRLIELSGGSIRDLFHILNEAALEAEERGDELITLAAVERGAGFVRNELADTLAERKYKDSKGNEWHLTPQGYWRVLQEIFQGNAHPPVTRELQELLHSRCVLQYNGEQWYDVHPLLKPLCEQHLTNFQGKTFDHSSGTPSVPPFHS